MGRHYGVLKFGGSCLSSAEDFSNGARIIAGYEYPVVVVSAVKGVTQQLMELSTSGNDMSSMEMIHEIQRKHLDALSKITVNRIREPSLEELRQLFQELIDLAINSKFMDPAERTASVLSYGEKFSAVIMKWYLENNNMRAEALSASEIIVANGEDLKEASVDLDWSRELIRHNVASLHNKGLIPVITGFFCRTPMGKIALLGRNSSDYTAALVSGSLNGSSLTFWKDVPGLMTGDPKFARECKVLRYIGYGEAEGYISNGAKILHRNVIQVSRENGVPIRIRDFRNPDMPGTIIGNPAEIRHRSDEAPF